MSEFRKQLALRVEHNRLAREQALLAPQLAEDIIQGDRFIAIEDPLRGASPELFFGDETAFALDFLKDMNEAGLPGAHKLVAWHLKDSKTSTRRSIRNKEAQPVSSKNLFEGYVVGAHRVVDKPYDPDDTIGDVTKNGLFALFLCGDGVVRAAAKRRFEKVDKHQQHEVRNPTTLDVTFGKFVVGVAQYRHDTFPSTTPTSGFIEMELQDLLIEIAAENLTE